MGNVYLAHNILLDRPEVLKVISKEYLRKPGARDRFLREIRSAARLNHPNVVAAYSALTDGDSLALAMEYVPGRDLEAVVGEGGPLPVAAAAAYAVQVARGLQHAHERGMVHRDIKPANLIVSDGAVKILDFGLAKVCSEAADAPRLTHSAALLGTPAYMAPEQSLDPAAAGIRADLYSLGCTLYFLLTGKPPFEGQSLYTLLAQHQTAAPTPLREIRPEVPAGLADAVAVMMAKKPSDRYASPQAAADALRAFADPAAVSTPEAAELGTADRAGAVAASKLSAPRRGLVSHAPQRRVHRAAVGVSAAVCLGVVALTAGGAFRKAPPEELPRQESDAGRETVAQIPTAPRHPVEKPAPSEPAPKAEPPAVPAPAEEKLFETILRNGVPVLKVRDLSQEPRPKWLTEDGAFTAPLGGNRLFAFDRRTVADFHLAADVKVVSGSGGELIFRAAQIGDRPRGYSVSLGGSGKRLAAAGAIFEWHYMSGETKSLFSGDPQNTPAPDTWFAVEVEAIGGSFTSRINGKVVGRAKDPKNTYQKGWVGFAAVPTGIIAIRNVKLRNLADE